MTVSNALKTDIISTEKNSVKDGIVMLTAIKAKTKYICSSVPLPTLFLNPLS